MFQKRMRRAAMILLTAALLLTAPLQAAGWTSREAPGVLETAWGWLLEWVTGTSPTGRSFHAVTAADEAPIPPGGQPGGETPPGPGSDDGGGIDPNG